MVILVLIIGFVAVTSGVLVIQADMHRLRRQIMAKFDDVKAQLEMVQAGLGTIETGVAEVNSDLDIIITKLGEGNADGLTAAQTDEIIALVTDVAARTATLQTAVSTAAGKYPAVDPPPVE